jgi:Carboxypeptidase regulatory-like domain/TonB dependent receptor
MMKLGRVAVGVFALLVGLVSASSRVQSQGIGSASLNGTVTDSSGAVVTGAGLTLVDTRTNTTYTAQSGKDGGYRIVDIPPGPAYTLTVTKNGFETFALNGLYIPVATATTKDVQLQIGQVSQTVEVTSDTGSVSLNTTDAAIGNNLDMHAVESLPNEFRDTPANLLRIEAGVVSAQTNAGLGGGANVDPNHTRDGAVAGARTDQNNITVDGIDATDFAVGGSFSLQASLPVEAIQEFNTQIAQPSAAYGGRSGAQTVIVTKSGTDLWHGSLFEYNRTAATEANTFFNNQSGVPRLALVRNQFGGNVGGPVLKDKLFFFFEYDGRRDRSALSELQFVPFPHVAAGEIAYINNSLNGPGGTPCPDSSRLTAADVSTPCVTIAPASEVQALDPCHAAATCAGTPGFVAAGASPALLNLFNTRYPKPNDFAVGDGLNTAGILFNAPAPVVENQYVSRVDYNISANNKLFARFNLINETQVDQSNGNQPVQFPGDPLTAITTSRDRAWVVGETWTINPNAINQFTVGETRGNDQFPITFGNSGPLYELSFFGSFAGSSFATPYERQTASGRVVPDPTVRDDMTLIRGKHTIQFGGQWNPVKVRSGLTNDLIFITEGLGGAVSGLTPAFRPTDISTSNSASSNWDNFFLGDLGLINGLQAAINYNHAGTALPFGSGADRDFRIYEMAGYLEDSWRIRNDLTLTAGVRYQYQTTPYEVHGTEAQFFNTSFDNLVATRVANGLAGISGPNATPLLSYQLSGKANPGGAPLYPAEKHDFSPRLALAWNPSFTNGFLGRLMGDRKTVIRAGADLVYDESVIYSILAIEDQSNYLFGNTVANTFNQGQSLTTALTTDPRFNSVNSVPFPITPPAFVTPLTPFATFNFGIDNHLQTPYSIAASFGVQRSLPGGFQLDMDYYGRFGRRLILLGDAGQAINFVDPTPDHQSLVQAFSNLEVDSRQNSGAGVPAANVTQQPFFETNMNTALAGIGQTCATFYAPFPAGVTPSCTAAVYLNNFQALQQGGTGGILPGLPLPPNVGLTPQFFVDALATNRGFSDYNALFVTLRKRLSNNLQFDFNYTYSHSIDNGSTISNENGNFESGVTSVMCDATNNSACRGNSEFDATHQVSAEFVYDLPFGRGQKFGRDSGRLLNEAIGGWQVSGVETWRTGLAYTANGTDIATFDTVSLAADTGALFTGSRSELKPDIHIDGSGQLQYFADPVAAAAQFSPVTGLQSGDRDTLRGPHFSNTDLAVSKNFPLAGERYKLQFRAEAYNLFNHPNFGIPDTGVSSGRFGVISGLAGQEPARVMQFALRFDF